MNYGAPPEYGRPIPPIAANEYPAYMPQYIPTPARANTGPGLVIFLASGAAAGIGVVRRRFLRS